MKRAAVATVYAIGAFVIVCFASCEGLMYTVRNSNDGQAGMGAAFGGFYAGILAAIVTFVVSFRRNSPSNIAKRESRVTDQSAH
jgi:membrane associated rhomboid family serine protease